MATSIAVIHYDEWDRLVPCVERVLASPPRALDGIAVVDNASPDRARHAEFIHRFPQVQWVQAASNRGFAAAVNLALTQVPGEVVVIVTADVLVGEGTLEELARRCAVRAETGVQAVGIAGCSLRNPDGSAQGSSGPDPALIPWLLRLVLPPARRQYYLRPPTGTAVPVDWVTGAVFAVTRACHQRVGGMDEEYFMYYEDADFCRRARAAGFAVVSCGEVHAIHVNPHATGSPRPTWLRARIRQSQVRYFQKFRPAWEHHLLRCATRVYLSLRGWPHEPRQATHCTRA